MKEMTAWLTVLKLSRKKFLFGGVTLAVSAWLKVGKSNQTKAKNYFKHGIASGDPLQDRVIIWTRIVPRETGEGNVCWEVSESKTFKRITKFGECAFGKARDFTVKVDVIGLKADTPYYYRFRYLDSCSPIGRTRTLPETLDGGAFKLAVVACNNWEAGYFNAFRFLAHKDDVHAVLHLGDYIYEYESGRYGDISIGRIHDPQHEIVSLTDYRRRYALYRSDPDLQLLHARKPFYMVWDDHEFANNAYESGAENHQPSEGEWRARKQAAIQAYFEWLPVRATTPEQMCKKISIGNDLELFFLDQRMSGRTKQLNVTDPKFENEERTLLGHRQYQWLEQSLGQSRASWKLIANQIMFTGYSAPAGDKRPSYDDWWVGYPHERRKLMHLMEHVQISNVVFLTGDHHKSFIFALHPEKTFMTYTKPCSIKPLAWELLTPSITSKNASHLPAEEVAEMEEKLYQPDVNPHLLYADIKNHGYYIATITPNRLRADYYYVDTLRTRDAAEDHAESFEMEKDEFLLRRTNEQPT